MTLIEALLERNRWNIENKHARRTTRRKDRHTAKKQIRHGAFDQVRTKGQTKTQGWLSH